MKNSFSLILLLVLICCAVLSLSLGRFYIAPSNVMATLFHIGGSEIQHNIIFNLRLPRVIAAILVGAALAASGAVYQGVFRTPLVSPDLLGVSSGACVGASFAILCGWGILATQTSAFIGGIIAVMITMTIPKLMQRNANILLILSGIIVSGFMMACLGLLKYLADPETQLADIVYWQLGSLTKTDYHNLRLLSPIILVTLLLLFAIRWRINVLSLGEREATLVGVNVKFERNVMVVNATLLTASAVCLSGTIGWIGLIIPHLSRLMIGDNNVKTLPITMLLGAIFLLVVDTVARNLYAQEIPLGIITGFLGAPCFAWALIKQKRVS